MEEFTPAERARLAPHFSNMDGPVFALVDLPETVKGAMFARYSRYPGTLRRLFLDEFADSLPERVGALDRDVEGARAAELFERIFVGFGDDSVAQLGGAHIAVEWCSNVLTKVLQRPRLASYLEQSTRYIAYDAPMPGGGYRYHRDAALGPEYEQAMDSLFGAYSQALPRVADWVDSTYPAAPGESDAVRRRAVKAKALDLLRGLLPAASLSHMGIYASRPGLRAADPAPARAPAARGARVRQADARGGQGRDPELRRPRRAPRPRRRLGRLPERAPRRRAALGRAPGPGPRRGGRAALVGRARARRRRRGPAAGRAAVRGRGLAEERTLAAVAALGEDERARMLGELVGERANRRHRPGRGFEALRYRFEIVSDYGAFRDLQRHRMLTVQWQPLTPDLGAEIPEEVTEAGCGDLYARALERSRAEYERLRAAGHAEAAPYALCLGYRIRYVLDLNAREAMHLTELRSAREGHAVLPRRRAGDAHRDRRGPPRGGGDDVPRRPLDRAAPRTHPGRDPRRVAPRVADDLSPGGVRDCAAHDCAARRDEVLAAANRARSAALVARDAAALTALHHERFRFTTPRGDVRDREEYVGGNTGGELVWRAQVLDDAEVVVEGDTAVLTAIARDEFERGGQRGAHAMRLTLTWTRCRTGRGWRSPGTRGQRSDNRLGPGPHRASSFGRVRPIGRVWKRASDSSGLRTRPKRSSSPASRSSTTSSGSWPSSC